MSALKGWPPKVIWIRLGNCRTAVIEMVLHNSVDAIQRFGDGEAACLMLGRR
jgi:predicted nuclease of predicted toxin-antitoxin system